MKLHYKRNILTALCLLLAILLCSCRNSNDNNKKQDTTIDTEAYIMQTNINPSFAMNTYLNKEGITKSKIIKCPDINSIRETVYFRDATNDEISEYVNDAVENCNYFTDITNRDIVEKDDFIYTDYTVYFNGEKVAEAKNEFLKVGAGYYMPDFENAVVGAKKGEPFTTEIKSPVATDKYNVGDVLSYEIVVNAIQRAIIFTTKDEQVWYKYDVESEEAFLNYCKDQVQNRVNVQSYLDAQKRIYKKLIESSDFDIDEKELENYAIQILESQKEMAPILYDLSFEDYVSKIMNLTMDEFNKVCRDKAEADIKEFLINAALCEQLKITSNKTDSYDYYQDVTYQIHKYMMDNIMIPNN